MRGPKPKPVEQKIKEGNPGKRKLPEPVLIGGRPELAEMNEPPEHLDDDAKEWWLVHVPRLLEVGILDRVDTPHLEMLATSYSRWRQAGRVLASEGLFQRGSVGQIKEHSALKIERAAKADYDKTCEQYGLSPLARTRLGLAELSRRSLAQEMSDSLGAPKLKPKAVVQVNL